MRESSTYQLILDEGREEGRAQQTQRLILRSARARLGDPGTAVETALQAIADVDRLERMFDRLPVATSWHDLLHTP